MVVQTYNGCRCRCCCHSTRRSAADVDVGDGVVVVVYMMKLYGVVAMKLNVSIQGKC